MASVKGFTGRSSPRVNEVTNIGHDRSQLANMAWQAKEVTGADGLTVLADRGYFSGEEVVACEAAGVTPIVPSL